MTTERSLATKAKYQPRRKVRPVQRPIDKRIGQMMGDDVVVEVGIDPSRLLVRNADGVARWVRT